MSSRDAWPGGAGPGPGRRLDLAAARRAAEAVRRRAEALPGPPAPLPIPAGCPVAGRVRTPYLAASLACGTLIADLRGALAEAAARLDAAALRVEHADAEAAAAFDHLPPLPGTP